MMFGRFWLHCFPKIMTVLNVVFSEDRHFTYQQHCRLARISAEIQRLTQPAPSFQIFSEAEVELIGSDVLQPFHDHSVQTSKLCMEDIFPKVAQLCHFDCLEHQEKTKMAAVILLMVQPLVLTVHSQMLDFLVDLDRYSVAGIHAFVYR